MAKQALQWRVKTTLEKRYGDINQCKTPEERLKWLKDTKPFDVIEKQGNIGLNTGLNELWDLFIGSSANHFDNTNSRIGVGDDNTAAAAAQTDLQASTNKYYGTMEATFPSVSNQTVSFKISVGSSDGNFAWNEWVIKNNASSICLNRKVESLGIKSSGATWTLTVEITLS